MTIYQTRYRDRKEASVWRAGGDARRGEVHRERSSSSSRRANWKSTSTASSATGQIRLALFLNEHAAD